MGKKTIWIYAVILFTSAFIVLLISAYSQMKFKKNANEYSSSNEINNEIRRRIHFSLSSAVDENEKLAKENTEL